MMQNVKINASVEKSTTNNKVGVTQRLPDKDSYCKCGDWSNTFLPLAASAWAQSNSSVVQSYSTVNEFRCKFPNKWKAGIDNTYSTFHTAVPLLLSGVEDEVYESSAFIKAESIDFDCVNNRIVFGGLEAVLKKYTPDMTNDYTTFVINIGLVISEDSDGNEVERSLYSCKVTIFDDELVIDDAAGVFRNSDFTEAQFGTTAKSFVLNTGSKTVQLLEDIIPDSDINVSLSTDCRDYEDGVSEKFAVSTGLTDPINEKIKQNAAITLDILQNPITGSAIEFSAAIRDLKDGSPSHFVFRNFEGVILKQVELLVSDTPKKFTIAIDDLPNGIYLLSLSYRAKEYARKVIINR